MHSPSVGMDERPLLEVPQVRVRVRTCADEQYVRLDGRNYDGVLWLVLKMPRRMYYRRTMLFPSIVAAGKRNSKSAEARGRYFTCLSKDARDVVTRVSVCNAKICYVLSQMTSFLMSLIQLSIFLRNFPIMHKLR